jgi:hypothetical protein
MSPCGTPPLGAPSLSGAAMRSARPPRCLGAASQRTFFILARGTEAGRIEPDAKDHTPEFPARHLHVPPGTTDQQFTLPVE